MTGQEFKRLVAIYGTQVSVARAMGVQTDTIRARYNEELVPLLYEQAIIGVVLRDKLAQIIAIAELIG